MRNLLVTTAILFFAAPAFAENWLVDMKQSSLTFEATQTSQPVPGRFDNFVCEIEFNETQFEKGKIHISVDMNSVKAESKEASEALPTAEWLDIKKFPQAEFTSTSIKKTGVRDFEATGNLTIHGITHEVTMPFTLKPEGLKLRAVGEITLQRNDFKVGSGQWNSDRWVAYPVRVRYNLLTTPK